jgi:hypothetical protein
MTDASLSECGARRLLLRQFVESNQEYRAALARCRVCKSCLSGETNCKLEEYLAQFDAAHQRMLEHIEQHGC